MTLMEFIQNTLKAYSLKFSENDVKRYIMEKARAECQGSSIAIDDETIKEWILNYDPAKAPAPKAEVKAVEKPKPKQESKPAPKPKKEKKNDEQISIFDLL